MLRKVIQLYVLHLEISNFHMTAVKFRTPQCNCNFFIGAYRYMNLAVIRPNLAMIFEVAER